MRPELEMYSFVQQPDNPTWDDLVALAQHDPAVWATLMRVERYGVSREQALIALAFWNYNQRAGTFKREVDRLNTEVPDFVMMDGKRYDRRT